MKRSGHYRRLRPVIASPVPCDVWHDADHAFAVFQAREGEDDQIVFAVSIAESDVAAWSTVAVKRVHILEEGAEAVVTDVLGNSEPYTTDIPAEVVDWNA